MGIIASTISAIVGSLSTTTTYVRASKLEEGNKKLITTDLSDPIALYFNLPVITTEETAGGTIEVHPVEIAFLKKSEPDNTGVQDDVLRDAMKASALEFYQSLVTNYSGTFERFQGYELDPVNIGEKYFAEVMTGFTLKTDIRLLSTCSAVSVVGTLLNSEGTTINTLSPGETKTQPDITVTQLDDTTAAHPSDKDLDVDNFLGGGAPACNADWDTFVSNVGRGYHYPSQTGATTSYRTPDDAYIESNLLTPAVRAANSLSALNSLSNFTTLNNNNSFGNTNRFTDSVGGQDYDGTGGSLTDYIIDHYTGIGWYFTGSPSSGNWNTAIDNSAGSDFGGSNTQHSFTDWFLPNTEMMLGIANYGTGTKILNYAPFSYNTNAEFYTSTTSVTASTHAFYLDNTTHDLRIQVKTNSDKYIFCRKHF